jgi:hypothetical protein
VHGLFGSIHLYLYVNRALLRIIVVEKSNLDTPSGRSLTYRISATSGNNYAVDLQGTPFMNLCKLGLLWVNITEYQNLLKILVEFYDINL